MPGFASLLAASALHAASLNLCTDEYLLLLARPGEIVGVSRLAQDPAESPLWRRARAHPANRGAIEQVLGALEVDLDAGSLHQLLDVGLLLGPGQCDDGAVRTCAGRTA